MVFDPPMDTSRERARHLDQKDDLAAYRQAFVFDPDIIYLDGNSLGCLPKRTLERLQEVITNEWGHNQVRGWERGWLTAPERLGSKIALLLGAGEDEVMVADSTSVNLFKLVMAVLTARPERHTLITDDLNFSSNLYVLQGAAQLAGPAYKVKVIASTDGATISPSELAAAVDDDTALVSLSHTAYKSGYMYDMGVITEIAHQANALMLWDLSHSVGAMPLNLSGMGVDLAVGCTYKYLNGGPGAPAFVYVWRGLQNRLRSPIWGWFGQQDQFAMGPQYEPAKGMKRFLAGTPPILSLLAIEPAIDMIMEAGLSRIRTKAVRQTEYLIGLWEAWLKPLGMELNSPRNFTQRGSHVALQHPEALRIKRALIEEMRVIPDLRYPDILRFGLAPLHTSYTDVYEAMLRLKHVLETAAYTKYPAEKPLVP